MIISITNKYKCIILIVIGLVFYANTYDHGYVIDDDGVIANNVWVHEGVKGVWKILSNNSFAGAYIKVATKEPFSGGRYRPLSVAFFAVEYNIFGDSPHAMHLVNLCFYILLLLTLFYFLDEFLCKDMPSGSDIAFIAALLFAIHPIHTEVVNYLKSLDDIMSLLFTLCTFIFSLRYLELKEMIRDNPVFTVTNPSSLWRMLFYFFLGLFCYFLSLLSKEYGITFIVLLPLLFYLKGHKKFLINTFPYAFVLLIYMLIRQHALSGWEKGAGAFQDTFFNAYLLATPVQAIATKIYIVGKYLFMLLFPYPLSCDYGYYQITYRDFSDGIVWLSLLVNLAIIVWGGILFFKKDILSFPIIFYCTVIAIVSNFAFSIGAIIAERFDFQASLGFTVILAWAILNLAGNLTLKARRIVIVSFLSFLTLISGAEVMTRNRVWKDDFRLYTTDINTCPNSEFLTSNAGFEYMEMAASMPDGKRKTLLLRDTAMPFLRKSLALDPELVNSYINLGAAYFYLGVPDSAKCFWNIAKEKNPDNPFNKGIHNHKLAILYLQKGIESGKNGYLNEGIRLLKEGINIEPSNPYLWYNLGRANFILKNYDTAKYEWAKTLQIDSAFADAKRGMEEIKGR